MRQWTRMHLNESRDTNEICEDCTRYITRAIVPPLLFYLTLLVVLVRKILLPAEMVSPRNAAFLEQTKQQTGWVKQWGDLIFS